MNRRKNNWLAGFTLTLGLLLGTQAVAQPIFYTATDLADVGTPDVWRYDYEIANTTGVELGLFDIFFDATDYDFLLEGSPPDDVVSDTSFAVADGWFATVLQEGPFPGEDGIFSISFGELFEEPIGPIAPDIGLAVTGFSIEFIWTGTGTPGEQAVDAYTYADYISGDPFASPYRSFSTELRNPISVPEPDSLILLSLGLGALALKRRRCVR